MRPRSPRPLRPAGAASPRVAPRAASTASSSTPLYLGLDLGTSGGRGAVVDATGHLVADARVAYTSSDWAVAWRDAALALVAALPVDAVARVVAVAVAGTSASVLLVDGATGNVLAPARLYNDAASEEAVTLAGQLAGGKHPAAVPTAALCKTLDYWLSSSPLPPTARVVSAADYAIAVLGGNGGHCLTTRLDVTDDNNALKAGWDPGAQAYEEWWSTHPTCGLLPQTVVAPGAATGVVAAEGAPLPPGCSLAGGTTDSVAAFVAAVGADPPPGTAVTSLGSTLALKLASDTRVDDGASGVYSHRLNGNWLVGGASNVGCAVLRDVGFSDGDLETLSRSIDGATPAPHAFYPLRPNTKGERFPVVDPEKVPVLTPRADDDAAFLKCILDGVARVEAAGYGRLVELGAPPPSTIHTAGGGSRNPVWTALRSARLAPAEVVAAECGEAAVGAALLARSGSAK